eukprot:2730607-Pleurochrysis_carterae.AAC.1
MLALARACAPERARVKLFRLVILCACACACWHAHGRASSRYGTPAMKHPRLGAPSPLLVSKPTAKRPRVASLAGCASKAFVPSCQEMQRLLL